MTVFLPFQPSAVAAPTFYVTMDGVYSLTVKWNVSAQRYYYDLYDPAATWLVSQPLIELQPSVKIFSWTYLPDRKAMLFTGEDPKARSLGQMIDGTIEGVDPPVLNGPRRYMALSAAERIFPLAQDPGQISQLGSVNHYVNLVGGYVQGWTVVFRNNQFEVFRG